MACIVATQHALDASRLVNLLPAPEKGLADAMHARLGTMIVVFGVSHHLCCCTPIRRGKRLVPFREHELFGIRRCVLDAEEDQLTEEVY